MTRAYGMWSSREPALEAGGDIPWTSLVPPGWQGFCVYCRRRLTVKDWQDGGIAAAGDGDPWHCLCIEHLGPNGPEYQGALNALARAVAGK